MTNVILILKDCNGCSFRKAEKEYLDGLANAERILEEKVLKSFEYAGEIGLKMGVQPK